MKKQVIIWSTAALVILTAGIVIARADRPMGHGWRHHHGPLGYISHELNLSDTQKSQIQTIWQGEKPTIASLVREISAENKEMDAATAQGNFDDSKVQPIADRQAATIAKLLVEKEKLKSQIYSTVLNADQRSKADKLQERWHSRFDRIAEHISDSPQK